MKGTQYARKNKINLEPYNQFEQYNFLLEDLINSRKVFVLSSAVSNAILKLAE